MFLYLAVPPAINGAEAGALSNSPVMPSQPVTRKQLKGMLGGRLGP
jgi:hypothetical protein